MVRTQVLKHLLGTRKGKRGESKENVRGGMTARGAVWNGGCIRIFEGRGSEEMVQSNTSSPCVWKYLLSSIGVMTIEVPQNEEISGGENRGRKGVSSAIHWRGINRGCTLRHDSKEELLREMLTPP